MNAWIDNFTIVQKVHIVSTCMEPTHAVAKRVLQIFPRILSTLVVFAQQSKLAVRSVTTMAHATPEISWSQMRMHIVNVFRGMQEHPVS